MSKESEGCSRGQSSSLENVMSVETELRASSTFGNGSPFFASDRTQRQRLRSLMTCTLASATSLASIGESRIERIVHSGN